MAAAKTEGEFGQPPMIDAILALADAIRSGQAQTAETQAKLAETLTVLQANQKPRDVNYGDTDYQARLKAERQPFPRPVYQNGFEADPAGESAETLALVADLRPGKYLGGFVTIEALANNGINFIYKNKTTDQRMTQMGKFSSFGDLVRKCLAESHVAA